MKTKLIAIILIITVLLFAGCSNQNEKPTDNDITSSSVSKITEISQEKKEENSEPESLILTTETAEVSESTDLEAVTTVSVPTTSSESKETEKTSKPSVKAESKPTETKPTETKQTEKQNNTEPPIETTKVENEPTPEPVVQRADRTEVEAKVAEYINSYRSSSATVLSGLTEVARYRSRELISNFAHTDGISACNALKYGEFVDMTLYGMSESDSYYQGYNREAIAKGNWGGSADEIAQKIANGFKNSSSHWKYLGSSEYSYMAVGCTYDETTSMWYCCICVSSKNYGG